MADDGPPTKKTRYDLRSVTRASRNTPLQEPKSEQPKTELMDLNDHCILTIFDYSQTNDLANLSQVNKRLNALVKKYIQLKYKLQFSANFAFQTTNGSVISLEVAQAYLSIFGNEIITLSLSSGSFVQETDVNQILPFVQKHCNLKELTVKNFGMKGLNNGVFQQIEKLTLDNCSVSREWCKMSQLKTLKVNQFIVRRWPLQYSFEQRLYLEYGMYTPNPPISIPVHSFGGLEEIQISDTNFQNDIVAKLIESIPALKKLSVIKSIGTSTAFFKSLVGLKQLEVFEFKKNSNSQGYIHELKPLISLKNLKTLKLTYKYHPAQQLIDGLLNNGISLDHLELGTGRFDNKTAENIAKMTSIKVLKLNGMAGLNQSHVVTMVKGLKLLEELHIKTMTEISRKAMQEIVGAASRLTKFKFDGPVETLDRETYQAILTSIQTRAERSVLQITFYGNGNPSIPSELFKDGDDEWFLVEELDRSRSGLFESLISTVSLEPPPSKQRHYYSSSDTEYDSDY